MPPVSAEMKIAAADAETIDLPDNVDSGVFLKHKRRYCRIEGCQRIVKSQGLCQRHGAKPKNCKVAGCTKQAQGNFDKMCKAHFKAMKRQTTPIPKVVKSEGPPPIQGRSVFDEILPKSISYSPSKGGVMPLIAHLKHGFDTSKPPAWHRNEERAARGILQIDNPAQQLEGWERELVWMEILVLTGVPGASFRHLARAWGRDKGFHMVLAQFICERHGNVERKKRQAEIKAKTDREDNLKNKSLRFKRRKVNRYGLPAKKEQEDLGVDVWDTSMYGDADTNEALASEIFDFSEKEFNRVTAKYRDMSNASVGSETASSGSQNVLAQAAMTAILGDENGDEMQQNLPEAAVALAAMNRIPAPLPQAYKAEQSNQQTKPSQATPSVANHHSIDASTSHSPSERGLQMQPQSQQVQQQQSQQSSSFDGFVQQSHVQPQVQQITQVTTFIAGLEPAPQQQSTNQPVYNVHQGAGGISHTTESSSNFAPTGGQTPNVHANQESPHLSENQNVTISQHAPAPIGQLQQNQYQVGQAQHVLITPQQPQILSVLPQHQVHQEMVHQPQHGHQVVQQQFQQQLAQELPQVQFQVPPQVQFNAQPPQIQFHDNQSQQPQVQHHQKSQMDRHSHYQASHEPTQQGLQDQLVPVDQVHEPLQAHLDGHRNQPQFDPIVDQHVQHQRLQDAKHSALGQEPPQTSHKQYNDVLMQQQQQPVPHNDSLAQHMTVPANQHQAQQQISDSFPQQHGLQQGMQGQSEQFGQQQVVGQQFSSSLQQDQQHGSGQVFQGQADHSNQNQQRVHQQVHQQPAALQLFAELSHQHQQQQQLLSQQVHDGQHAPAPQNQHQSSSAHLLDSSQQQQAQIHQSTGQQQVNQQVQYNQGNPLQQRVQDIHVPNPAPIQGQLFQQSWPPQQTPQLTHQQHGEHNRHHRRQQSQPVYFQQGQSPGQHRNHRRQFSQPAYLHDLGMGQIFSFSLPQQQHQQQQSAPSQEIQPTYQQTEASAPTQALEHVQPSFQDHQVQDQHVLHTEFQQQLHEQHQQQDFPPQGHVAPQSNYQQDPQASQSVFQPDIAQHAQSHLLQPSQEGHFHESQQHVVQQQHIQTGDAIGQQQLVHHPHDGVGHDPLDIHHEMHVAQASDGHYHQETH